MAFCPPLLLPPSPTPLFHDSPRQQAMKTGGAVHTDSPDVHLGSGRRQSRAVSADMGRPPTSPQQREAAKKAPAPAPVAEAPNMFDLVEDKVRE